VRATHHAAVKPAAAAHPTSTSAVTPDSHDPIVVHHPHCTSGGVGVQCAPPKGTTLYLNVGPQAVGLTNDLLPVDCTSLPQTAVTHCEPSDRKN